MTYIILCTLQWQVEKSSCILNACDGIQEHKLTTSNVWFGTNKQSQFNSLLNKKKESSESGIILNSMLNTFTCCKIYFLFIVWVTFCTLNREIKLLTTWNDVQLVWQAASDSVRSALIHVYTDNNLAFIASHNLYDCFIAGQRLVVFPLSIALDAYETAKLLCEQYYLGAPELELRQMNG